jgi:hypothetical protein
LIKEKENIIMSLLGLAVNLCSTASVNHALKVLGSVSSGSKFMDKVVIPIGTFCVSCYVGDKVAEHVDKQIADAKENLETIKELRKMTKAYDAQFGKCEDVKENDERVVHNVFEENANEEVNENAD